MTGDTSYIAPANYADNLVWNSLTDQPGQPVAVWFRITPRDTLGAGPADTTAFDLDNEHPDKKKRTWKTVPANSERSTLWNSQRDSLLAVCPGGIDV